MENKHLPQQSHLSTVYRQDLTDLMDFNSESGAVTGIQQENSPLIRLLSTTLCPQKEVGSLDLPVYNLNILRLLDDLQCPVLLLPRIKNDASIQRIGFLTDVLFTSRATLALLVKLAKSLQANITLFNIPEAALPEMDPGYARRHFTEQGLSHVNGEIIKLVNISKKSSPQTIETIFDYHNITIAAASKQRKELLYRLVS